MNALQQMEPEVLFERREQDGATWAEIILNRPSKGNALTMDMLRTLDEWIRAIEADPSIQVVVLRARGRYFCTGGDIAAWGSLGPREMARDWILPGIDTLSRLTGLNQPVVAVLSGHALGGGLELAMAADLRIAVQTAKLGMPEVGLGMIPGWMGTRRLAELIGPARARHMILLGTPISAEQALDWGLITAIAQDEPSLQQQADAWREQLCSNAPAAMALVKGLLAPLHADERHHHASAVASAAATEDCREGVRAFHEKRRPVFLNR